MGINKTESTIITVVVILFILILVIFAALLVNNMEHPPINGECEEICESHNYTYKSYKNEPYETSVCKCVDTKGAIWTFAT